MTGPLRLGDFEIYWLDGGEFELEGGCMFGVVPRALWEKKFPCSPDGFIRLVNTPILVRTPTANVIIDTGLGNKLTAKQKQIFRVTDDWRAEASLDALGLKREEISHVILTHCDFDHAGGVVRVGAGGQLELTWPEARHYVQRVEWREALAPNRRSASSYWPVNLELLGSNGRLELVDGAAEPVAGVRLQLTGGHTRGHQAVWLESAGERAVHLGDLLPSQAYFNPLWITPYDNFPLDSVAAKEELLARAVSENRWCLFYHDPYLAACRFDRDGKIIERFAM
ncbi:MAG TPA: MBL fold metallo-hydrolase [Desulfurivibrionaceae bacterium]|nr:MBL fold metallo-hydrolase [Desulfurivibrionaceae bacterium]